MKKQYFVLLALTALLLSGCGSEKDAPAVQTPETAPTLSQQVTGEPAQEQVPDTQPEQPRQEKLYSSTAPTAIMSMSQEEMGLLSAAPTPAIPVVLQPEAPGTLEKRTETSVIDYSNCADGYVMAQFTGGGKARLKLRVFGPATTYTYNLPIGEWTTYPLSDGNGTYKITIYQNIGGSQYATVSSHTFDVELNDEFAPFLRPNQYVNYADSPDTMAMGQTLCQGITDPLEKVAAVYDYVVDNMSYDYKKASSVKSGYLPVLDTVLAEQKGICFDYAALMAAMLRSQQVPCKLVVGYAGSQYHAWISVWTEENGWMDGAIFFDGNTWKRMDPTFASSSERSPEILEFIENGRYKEMYLY